MLFSYFLTSITTSFSEPAPMSCLCSRVGLPSLFCLYNLTFSQLRLFWLLIVAKLDVNVLGFLPLCISNGESLVPACGVNLSVSISSSAL